MRHAFGVRSTSEPEAVRSIDACGAPIKPTADYARQTVACDRSRANVCGSLPRWLRALARISHTIEEPKSPFAA